MIHDHSWTNILENVYLSLLGDCYTYAYKCCLSLLGQLSVQLQNRIPWAKIDIKGLINQFNRQKSEMGCESISNPLV